jgi:hypothetical protein
VVRVDDVGAHGFDQGSAGLEYCWDLPGVPGREIEIYGDYGGACFLIFGCEAGGGGGKGDYYFKTQGAQDADLVVDPGCSGGGFDDVQDLHKQRVVIGRSVTNALKTIPQKGAARRVQRWEQSLLRVKAGGIEGDRCGYKIDVGQ